MDGLYRDPMPADIVWTTAFLDFTPSSHETGVAFWSAVTGYTRSPSRGHHDEFATLVPDGGDAFLRVQRLAEGADRIHLDLHVADPASATRQAAGCGAAVVTASSDGHVVLTSPAGLVFCFVPDPGGRRRPPPTRWAAHTSLVDQVCIDVPRAAAEQEARFWTEVTGWPPHRTSSAPEFRPLVRPSGMPLRLMVQAVGDERQPATAHLDLACDDRAAETRRHVDLGARVRDVTGRFTVLLDPTGSAYCITDRDPATGLTAG